MFDTRAILIALAAAALILAASQLVPGDAPQAAFDTPVLYLAAWTVVSLPIAFALPRLRATFFDRLWYGRTNSYLMPRWVVRFFVGGGVGLVAGFFLLAILRDHRAIWLAGSFALVVGAFCAGASRRLKEPLRQDS